MLQEKYYNGVKIISVDKSKVEKNLNGKLKKIKKENQNVKNIFLFGSFIKGTFKPTSDIDVAIILKESGKNFVKRCDDFVDYFIDLGMDVNLLVYTEKEFSKMLEKGSIFAKEILKGKKI
jgi:predicted nucleotidyltransferase